MNLQGYEREVSITEGGEEEPGRDLHTAFMKQDGRSQLPRQLVEGEYMGKKALFLNERKERRAQDVVRGEKKARPAL